MSEKTERKPVYTKGVYSAHDIGTILKDGKKADIDELIDTLNFQHVKPKTLTDEEIDNKVNTLDDTTHYDAGYVKGFESGSEWARDLIEGKQ